MENHRSRAGCCSLLEGESKVDEQMFNLGEKTDERERIMSNFRRRTSSSWSDLYPELILSISQQLKTRFDLLTFRRVCKRWRENSVPLPINFLSPLFPLRFLPELNTHPIHPYCQPDRFDSELALVAKSIYLITPIVVDYDIENRSLSPWMVMATELKPGEFEFRHPLTCEQIEHLPNALYLTQFQLSELAQGYQLFYSNRVNKVVLCCSSYSSNDSTVIVLCWDGNLGALTLSGRRGFRGWSEPRHRGGEIHFQRVDDIVSFKGRFVSVDPHGRLFSMEYEAEDSRPLVVTGILAADYICNHKGRVKRLVVDPLSDKLYLVERERPSKVGFKVYEFNEECKKWDQVEALCHYRALFVGLSHCFFASASGFSGCLANCIVFVAESFRRYGGFLSDRSLFFNQNTNESIGIYNLGKRRKKFSYISDYPELLQMMQPPPACFSSSER